MNKKVLIIIGLILAIALIVGIVACNKDDEPTPPNGDAGEIGDGNADGNDDGNDDGNGDENGDGDGDGDGTSDQGEGGGSSEPEIEYAIWDGSIADGFEGGSGSSNDPYLIADGSQLAYLARQLAMGNESYSADGVCYKLTANIDLNNEPWSPIGSKNNISGIEEPACAFRGNFFGDGKIIKNLRINAVNGYSTGYGLFGYASSAIIENLIFDSPNISAEVGKTSPAGIAVGVIENSSVYNIVIENGTVTCNKSTAGGLIGESVNSSISDCEVHVILSAAYAGGLVAQMTGGEAVDCKVKGEMTVSDKNMTSKVEVWGGGFVGFAEGAEIKRSVTDVKLHGTFEYQRDFIGGFIGKGNNSTVYLCDAFGNVSVAGRSSSGTTMPNAAGFIASGGSVTVERCSSRGKVTGTVSSFSYNLSSFGWSNSIDCISTSDIEQSGYGTSCGFSLGGTSTRCISFGNVKSGGEAYSFGYGTMVSCVAFGDAKSVESSKAGVYMLHSSYPEPVNCYRAEDVSVIDKNGAVSASKLGGMAMFRDEMMRASFYSFDGGFAEAWDFSEMNISAGVYPKLKD